MRAFRLAYDGRPYQGFQRQPDVPTVEDTLFDALHALGIYTPETHRPAGYAAAGRTDAGVSALAQVVAFESPDWCSPGALNSQLPGSIRAWAAADVPEAFHATHDATRREYTYHLYAPRDSTESGDRTSSGGRTGAASHTVNDARVRDALAAFAGEHDFYNFTPDETGTVRDLATGVKRDGEFLVITIAASGFVRELVRRLVTLVHAIGTGAADLAKVDRLLGPEPVSGPEGVGPAPPTPLVLTDVDYPGIEFVRDPDAIASAREIFHDRCIEDLEGARAMETVVEGL